MKVPALKSAAKSLAVAVIVSTVSLSPALAGGSVSVTLTPENQKQEDFLRLTLLMAAVANELGENGGIKQNGNNNAAGLAQNGWGNQGIVIQDGDGHNGTLQQNGNNNAHGLFQFGKNTDGHVVQNGDEAGATIQFGW